VSGEIIVDTREYWNHAGRPSPVFVQGTTRIQISEIEDHCFTDEEILLCRGTVHGFSMTLKRWGEFAVTNVKKFEYNATAFDDLVIPMVQKQLIRSLVNDHEQSSSSFDDLIAGKGKGLIFLLHGPPGVGKTLTAGK
jgi:ATP-dependent 26S proteasome regulatory subunit